MRSVYINNKVYFPSASFRYISPYCTPANAEIQSKDGECSNSS